MEGHSPLPFSRPTASLTSTITKLTISTLNSQNPHILHNGQRVYLLQNHQGYLFLTHQASPAVPNQPHLLGEIPCMKLYDSAKTLAFLDIQPLSKGHAVRSPPFPLAYKPQSTNSALIPFTARDPQTPRRQTNRHPRRRPPRSPLRPQKSRHGFRCSGL